MSELNLGELEFKPQDFNPGPPNDFDLIDISIAAATANYLLRERLSKATQVFGHEDRDFGVHVYFDDEDIPGFITRTGRLVCIKEIKK